MPIKRSSLGLEVVIRTLQKAVRDTNDLYLDVYANEQLGQHSAALSTIMRVSGLLLARLGFKYTSPEHQKAIKRIWSVDRRRVFFEEWMKKENKGLKKPLVNTPSPYDLAGLKKEHARQKGKKPRG
jgi:hypothetical protein